MIAPKKNRKVRQERKVYLVLLRALRDLCDLIKRRIIWGLSDFSLSQYKRNICYNRISEKFPPTMRWVFENQQLLNGQIGSVADMKDEDITDKSDIKVITVCSLLALAIFSLDSLIPLGVAGGVPYILVVLISLWAHRKNLPVYMAIAGSILTMIGFFSSPPEGELWKVLANRTLALFAIWVVTILSVQRRTIHEEKEKVLQELKILSGLLPICASCKNIRDDQGYWSQIEVYIRSHSEAEFSHSICPDCVKKLYPDLEINHNPNNTGSIAPPVRKEQER